jgi:hypothetical protein
MLGVVSHLSRCTTVGMRQPLSAALPTEA